MLAELCAPKVGVITQLGDAHLGGFGNRQGVAEAKAELLAALPASGHAVLADDSWLRALSSRCRGADHLDRHRAAMRPSRGECRVPAGPPGIPRRLRRRRQAPASGQPGSQRAAARQPVRFSIPGLGPPSHQRRAGLRGRGPHDGLRPGRNRRGPGQLPGRADALRSDRNPRRDDHQRHLQFEPHRDAGGPGTPARFRCRRPADRHLRRHGRVGHAIDRPALADGKRHRPRSAGPSWSSPAASSPGTSRPGPVRPA